MDRSAKASPRYTSPMDWSTSRSITTHRYRVSSRCQLTMDLESLPLFNFCQAWIERDAEAMARLIFRSDPAYRPRVRRR